MLRIAPLILAVFALLVAPLAVVHAEDKIVTVPAGDPEMETAIAKARANLPDFWKKLASPAAGEQGFSLKVGISDAGNTEHFWLGDIRKETAGYSGTINNEPRTVKTVRAGQRYSFTEAQISDWMFIRNGKIVGNETMRPLLKRMPPDDARRYRMMLETP